MTPLKFQLIFPNKTQSIEKVIQGYNLITTRRDTFIEHDELTRFFFAKTVQVQTSYRLENLCFVCHS